MEWYQQLAEARITAANPLGRIIAGMLLAALEELHNCLTERDDHISRVNVARLDAAITSLRGIPASVWTEWCEMPKAEFIAGSELGCSPLRDRGRAHP